MTQRTLKKYFHLIDETIKRNNKDLYSSLTGYLRDLNLPSALLFDSQLPTCLILTSSESASSIDTQFKALGDELEAKLNGAKIVYLDDKKCANSKSMVEHIIKMVH